MTVKGVGQVDVYTPSSTNHTSIARAIEGKNTQATAVIVQTSIGDADMAAVAVRVWGKPKARNIQTIFFQRPDGSIVRFNRPTGGQAMPKFACRCGYVMNLSNGTPSFEFALVPESRIVQIADKLDTPAHLDSSAFYDYIDEVRTTVYRCPSCGRIHVDEGNGLFNSFIPESLA